MPSGKTHLQIEWILLMGWAGIALLFWLRAWTTLPHVALFLGAYVFSMLLMSPDLDLSTSAAFHRWGPLRGFWLPYVWIFRHRQRSHHLFWGPMSRILYLVLLGLAGAAVYLLCVGRPRPRLVVSVGVFAPLLAGLYLPNLEHIAADRVSTWVRRKRRVRRL
jgi:uncharacterized metal-binding protein